MPHNARTHKRTTLFAHVIVTALLVVAFQTFAPHTASAASIKGNWRGAGTLMMGSGTKERFRCRVTYGRVAGRTFSVRANCASQSGKFYQTGKVRRISKSRYVGTIHNAEFGVSARVVITAKGKSQRVSMTNNHGSAFLSLRRR
ncbi:MAG: hypothetical protein ACRBCJ_07535 [Hyphomicrobiaceae bacterium]